MTAPRLIRLKELLKIVPLSRSTIYERMNAGTFPKALSLGGNVVAWRESEVRAWIDSLPVSGTENILGVAVGVAA